MDNSNKYCFTIPFSRADMNFCSVVIFSRVALVRILGREDYRKSAMKILYLVSKVNQCLVCKRNVTIPKKSNGSKIIFI